jgi:4-hydroxy-2-oxoheptanedioate aldolase
LPRGTTISASIASTSFLDDVQAAVLVHSLQFSPIAAAVRVPALSVPKIGRVLDAGADALIIPMINTPEEAALVVQAARYAPAGVRSFGPLRRDMSRDPRELEKRAALFVMIETPAAVANIEEICHVDGIAGIYVRPADLALGLGEAKVSNPPSARVRDAIAHVLQCARGNGLVAGIRAGSGKIAAEYAHAGFRLITLGSETQLLFRAAAEDLDIYRQEIAT